MKLLADLAKSESQDQEPYLHLQNTLIKGREIQGMVLPPKNRVNFSIYLKKSTYISTLYLSLSSLKENVEKLGIIATVDINYFISL